MSYDATAEPNEFFADTRDEAVSKAASFYGVDEDALKIEEPSDVFGLGARVVIVAVPKDTELVMSVPPIEVSSKPVSMVAILV